MAPIAQQGPAGFAREFAAEHRIVRAPLAVVTVEAVKTTEECTGVAAAEWGRPMTVDFEVRQAVVPNNFGLTLAAKWAADIVGQIAAAELADLAVGCTGLVAVEPGLVVGMVSVAEFGFVVVAAAVAVVAIVAVARL